MLETTFDRQVQISLIPQVCCLGILLFELKKIGLSGILSEFEEIELFDYFGQKGIICCSWKLENLTATCCDKN